MATLHVRDIPDKLYDRVRKLAASRNRSLSAEVIMLLDQAVRDEERRSAHGKAMASIRAHLWTPPVNAPDSVTMLREDRGR